MQSLFSAQQLGLDPGKLKVVHARYQESRLFSFDLFRGVHLVAGPHLLGQHPHDYKDA